MVSSSNWGFCQVGCSVNLFLTASQAHELPTTKSGYLYNCMETFPVQSRWSRSNDLQMDQLTPTHLAHGFPFLAQHRRSIAFFRCPCSWFFWSLFLSTILFQPSLKSTAQTEKTLIRCSNGLAISLHNLREGHLQEVSNWRACQIQQIPVAIDYLISLQPDNLDAAIGELFNSRRASDLELEYNAIDTLTQIFRDLRME